jgi:hypothetical protein
MLNFGVMIGVLTLDGLYPLRGFGVLDCGDTQLKGLPSEIGCAVAAAWTVQAISGRWRRKPSWVDRMGRTLGWFWIATVPLSWFSTYHS